MTDTTGSDRQFRALACAECRRQKLRCDRVFPCSSCRKRGCAALCPDGIKPGRAKKRNIAADGDIGILIERIQDLETALSELQAQSSASAHPLLSQELRDVATKFPNSSNSISSTVARTSTIQSESRANTSIGSRSESPDEDIVEGLAENIGTLSMTGYGKSKFFGMTEAGVTLLRAHENLDRPYPGTFNLDIYPELMNISIAFLPSGNRGFSYDVESYIEAYLPSPSEAWSLCETFFENAGYTFIPFRHSMFMDEIFSFFYQGKVHDNVEIPRGHRLALLLMVFALGELFDLRKPAVPPGGKRFYYLARAAMTTEPTISHPTLTAIQAIMLMTFYISLSEEADAIETTYILSGLNVKLAYTLGLHREWRRFAPPVEKSSQTSENIPKASEEELRRVIFQEVIFFECWQTVRCGRPCMLNIEQFDSGPPGLHPERDSIYERYNMEGQAWSYGFARECLIPVLNFAIAVKTPKYSEVLKMDKIIKDYKMPPYMILPLCAPDGSPSSFNRAAIIDHFSSSTMREILLLYLHRPYFSMATTKFSADPLGCELAPTVLTSFAAACEITTKICQVFQKEPELSVRIWIFWDQLFAPCVRLIFGMLAIHCPGCKLAPRAMAELDKIVELLTKAHYGLRASIVLPYASKLKEKAHWVSKQYYATARLPQTLPEIVTTEEFVAQIGKRPSHSPRSADEASVFNSSVSPTISSNESPVSAVAVSPILQTRQGYAPFSTPGPVPTDSALRASGSSIYGYGSQTQISALGSNSQTNYNTSFFEANPYYTPTAQLVSSEGFQPSNMMGVAGENASDPAFNALLTGLDNEVLLSHLPDFDIAGTRRTETDYMHGEGFAVDAPSSWEDIMMQMLGE
ncbi:hypothetical protein M422DRAFT_24037 [Sphaerobolus stellatus SS14]|nr:hypothetical protein M422DRAFT_24037 [Sphaerobolus stellatus SS14]